MSDLENQVETTEELVVERRHLLMVLRKVTNLLKQGSSDAEKIESGKTKSSNPKKILLTVLC